MAAFQPPWVFVAKSMNPNDERREGGLERLDRTIIKRLTPRCFSSEGDDDIDGILAEKDVCGICCNIDDVISGRTRETMMSACCEGIVGILEHKELNEVNIWLFPRGVSVGASDE